MGVIAQLFSRIGKKGFFGLLAISLAFSQLAFMAPALALDASLSGTVSGGNNGQSIENATVDVLDPSNNVVVGTDLTASDGHFEVVVAVGTYEVRVTPPAGSEYQVATINNVNLNSNLNLSIVLVLQPEVPPPPTYYTWTGKIFDSNGTFIGCSPNGNFGCFYLEAADGTRYTSTVNFSLFAYQVQAPAGQYKIGIDNGNGGVSDMSGVNQVIDLTSDLTQDFIINHDTVNIEVVDQYGNPVGNARAMVHTSGGVGTQLLPGYQVVYGNNTSLATYTNGTTGEPAIAQVLTGSPITSVIVDDQSSTVNFDTVTINNPTVTNGTITVQVQTDAAPPLPVSYTWTGITLDTSGNLVGGCGSPSPGCLYFEASDGTHYDSTVNFSLLKYQITAPVGLYKIGGGGFDMEGVEGTFNLNSDLTQDFIINHDTVNIEVVDQYGNPVSHANATVHTSGGTGTQYVPGHQVSYGNNSATASTNDTGVPAPVKILSGSPVTSVVVSDSNGTLNFDTVTIDNPIVTNGTIAVEVQTDAAPPPPVYHTLTAQLRDNDGNLLGCGTLSTGCVYLESSDGTRHYGMPNISLFAYIITAPAGQYKVGVEGSDSYGLTMSGTDPVIDLTSDATQSLTINYVKLNVSVIDQFGNPVTSANATVSTEGGTGIQLLPNYLVNYGGNSQTSSAGSDGIARVKVLPGSPITSVSVMSPSGQFASVTLGNQPAMTQDGSLVVQLQLPYAPAAPQNLSAPSPTNVFPSLSWNNVASADSYTIYRDGIEIGSSNISSFEDSTIILDGSYSYAVKACNEVGCSDSSSSVVVLYDASDPTLDTPTWSVNPQIEGSDTTLTVAATDASSGVALGEYFIGADPGEGNATPLNWNGTDFSVTLGADLAPGIHTVSIRAKDNAGNWSGVIVTDLVIVPLDATAPEITHVLNPPVPSSGWYSSPVDLTWTVTDPESEITEQVNCYPVTHVNDTTSTDYTCTATSEGGTNSVTVNIKYDATNPTLDTPVWTANPQVYQQDSTVSVSVDDAISGVAAGEYFIGADPGEGSGTAMTLSGGSLSTTLGASLPIGTHALSIRVKDNAGNWSAITTTNLTIEDWTAPDITSILTPSTPDGENGWYKTPAALTWTVNDPESAITNQSGCNPVTVSADTDADGNDYTCSATSSGGAASVTATIRYDSTAPTLGTPAWTASPVAVGSDTSFAVPTTDITSGVATGEYFIGADPGVGSATTLTWDGTNFSSNIFGANLAPGVYPVGIRAKDVAGNWSATETIYLVIYDPAGPTQATGQNRLSPVFGTDTLPGLTNDPNQKDKVDFGFDVRYLTNGQVDTASEFSFNYETGKKCKSPNPENCHITVFTATGFSWLTVNGTNSSTATFQGVGSLTVDGTTSSNPFRVVGIDAELLGSGSDNVTIYVYAVGADPNTATPIYQVSGSPQGQGVTVD